MADLDPVATSTQPARDGHAPQLLAALRKRLDDQEAMGRLDRIHAAFDADEAERAEYLREWNALREMALEQQKHDDEILKKHIGMI